MFDAEASVMPTGADLVQTFAHTHPRQTVCPGCEQDSCRTELHRLVYTFDPCACSRAARTHLMEQIWHRRCLADREALS